MTADHDVELSQVLMDVDALRDLVVDLRCWRDEGIPFERELAAASTGQQLVVSIGVDDGAVRSIGKAAFGVHYCDGPPMSVECSFVIDQSCVFLAMEAIANVLDNVVRQAGSSG
jgi:hypothetical protein